VLLLHKPAFVDAGLAGEVVDRVTTQCQDQEQLLREVQQDLRAFKKAYYRAESEMHDLEEKFEREKQALNDEIHRLRKRGVHGRGEGLEGNHSPRI